ncbi:MAG: nucleoside deaminase [Proteobacteria bacterium]|nr:nucleoside deaminase [Pseudomonadota bacterium]
MSLAEHERFMDMALDLAEESAHMGEVPVGALVVHNEEIIGRGANMREQRQDPLAHAEILAIKEAADHIGSWRLEDTTLYSTLEPCPMCAGAIINARIKVVVYGCDDPKAGAARTLYRMLEDPRLNHQCEVIFGVRASRASELLKEFFAELRRSKAAEKIS